MTDIQRVFNELYKNSIGMERLIDAHRKTPTFDHRTMNFPAYNIRKTGENHYEIEMAIAGYDIADIDVSLENKVLTVSSSGHDLKESSDEFLHRGFTYKAFKRSFTIDDNVRVIDAEMDNGVLRVHLQRIIPEEQKTKKIEVRLTGSKKERQLLTE